MLLFNTMNFKDSSLLLVFLWMLFLPKITSSQTIPPTLIATGDQYYCPLSQIKIATDFSIANPDNVVINAIYIQISTGYINGEDQLKYIGINSNITAQPFVNLEGKLILDWVGIGPPNNAELVTAVKNVVFQSSSTTPSGIRTFSITIGEANYLPSTGHYYEYISSLGITWQQAKNAAEALEYYGLKGYLATISSSEEAQLSGKQAAGAGWIGGSDADSEGVWKWVTGPEKGTIFWNGLANGSTPNYAFWNTNEPNNLGNEDYAHVTAPGVGVLGSWNDLSNTGSTSGDYQPKGYIVEYGWPGDPVLNFSTSTKISISEITAIVENSNCGAGIVNLAATASSGTVLWFDSLTGGNQVGLGTSFSTPPITSTTTFYALTSVNGCLTGKRNPVVATIYDIPIITSTTEATICGAGSGILKATASEGIVNWYDDLTGGNLVGTGITFTTPNLTSTTTYYVDATENGCTTTSRTPVILNVQYTIAPIRTVSQTFCAVENATISNLLINGTSILWYTTSTGGTLLNSSEILQNNTTYYASQTLNGCESPSRLAIQVIVYETVTPLLPSEIPILQECNTTSDGDDTNGFSVFDFTLIESFLLNGKSASGFTINYFTDATYLNQISNSTSFENTIINGQLIYVRMFNNLENNCFTDTSFNIQANPLPIIIPSIIFKNCDEDETPDGFTDYNLNEANSIITNGDNSLIVTYHLTSTDANNGVNILNPSPFNNINTLISNVVYARVENSFGCYRVSTVNLDVSTTTFPAGFNYEIKNCDGDNNIDGLYLFDLTDATQYFLSQLPPQNLSIHYYRNITDAQLEQNEISPQNRYESETPFLQSLYVRVENDDNGNCFGIGEHLTLTVYPRPEFEVNPTATICLNLPPITLETFNSNDLYTYEWTNESGTIISNTSSALVSLGGVYTVIATSNLNCESFPQTITVSEAIIANITSNDITITDDSENNTITINTANLGVSNYEFALDIFFGPYQDDPFFENVVAGIHTIFVQDKNDCGIAQLDVSVIGFPKFFTPNNDGYNDTWKIIGVNEKNYAKSNIYIFDRFGKFITQINPKEEGWDGLFKGKQLPATDYWFFVELVDNIGSIRTKKGHFSLIRR